MDFNNLFRVANNFFYEHTYVAVSIIAVVAVIAFLKPKQTIRAILMLLAAAAAAYVFYFIGDAALSGFLDKSRMLNK